MRSLRSVQKMRVISATYGLNRLAFFLLIALPILLMAAGAFASAGTGPQNFEKYAGDVADKTNILVDIFAYVAYLTGAVFACLGISELRKHVEGGNQAMPLRTPLAKLVFGGIFLSLPKITGMISTTFKGGISPWSVIRNNAYTMNSTGIKPKGLGEMIATGMDNTNVLVNVAALAAFIMAVFLIFRGIQMLKGHIDNPSNNPLPEALKRLAVGGALFSLPIIVNVVVGTFGATGDGLGNTGWSSTMGGGAGKGLDSMVINFITDIANPAFSAIEIFCYVAGILMVLFAMQRLVRTAQDGPRGPLGFGTIVMFFVAGALLSFPQLLSNVNTSLFAGSTGALTKVEFMALGAGVDTTQAKNVFSAILGFMAVIGFLSVVRGLFILKTFADGGQQATMMSVVTHIVAGAIAINLGAFINAIQTSLGVTTFPVTFN